MFRTFLSWRYLRHRRTNLIGIIGILVAVAALIMILSIMTGFLEQTKATVRGSLADIVIRPLTLQHATAKHPAPEAETLVADVRERPGVKAATPQYVWGCMIARGGAEAASDQRVMSDPLASDRSFVELVGIDLKTELETTELGEALSREPLYGEQVADPADPFAIPPAYHSSVPNRPRALLGDSLFASFGLHRGDEITVMTIVPDTKTGQIAPSNKTFVVAGSFRTKDNEMDMNRIYVERPVLVDFLRSDLAYTQVLVTLNDYKRDGKRVRDELQSELAAKGYIWGDNKDELRTWEEFRKTLLGAIENERVLMAIMLSLVLLVAGFTIFAILSMMVTEKRRDIGVLTALGATRAGVMHVFLMIAFWDALLGATLGAVIGTFGALEIDGIERWLSGSFSHFLTWITGREWRVEIFDRSIYYFDTIPSVVEPLWVATIVLGAFVCALLFAAIPAWRAARLDPLEALRYE